nr:hypothetical protein 2 [Rhodospirillaceae bacterium]
MTDDNTVPGDDTAATAPQPGETGGNEHLIPKARLDQEIGKRRALEEDVAHMAETILSTVPEKYRPLIPGGLSPAKQAAWIIKARSTGLFDPVPTDVPETDQGKPKVTPRDQNIHDLPPHARMASAYK